MKPFCLIVGVSACSLVFAQQPPALPQAPSDRMPPNVSVPRPEYVRPPGPTIEDGKRASTELMDLVRAQTDAIRALSGKVDSLDDRLRRIESRLR